MIIVAAHIMVKEGRNEEIIEGAKHCIAETRRENGCISYILLNDVENTQRYTFFEQWESRDDFDKHTETLHFNNFTTLLQNIESANVEIDIHEVTGS